MADEVTLSIKDELRQAIQLALDQQKELQQLHNTVRQQNLSMRELSRRLEVQEGRIQVDASQRIGIVYWILKMMFMVAYKVITG